MARGGYVSSGHFFLKTEDMKISCVMVTGHKPEKRALAKVAIACFHRQSWPDKELIIINEGEPFDGEINIPVEPGKTLGELRNIGLDSASGDFIMQWDDDDWYHQDRITIQLQNQVDDKLVLLQNEVVCDLQTGEAKACCAAGWRYGGFPGTVLYPSTVDKRYEAWGKSEDDMFLFKLPRLSIDNDPLLYVRTWNGFNTWDKAHYNMISQSARELSEYERAQVDLVIEEYLKAGYVQCTS